MIVIANRGTAFTDRYGFSPDYEIHDTDPGIPDMLPYSVWGSKNMHMSNSGDEVLLLDENDNVVDTLSWGNSIWAFDPAVKDVPEGISLERYPVNSDTNSAIDWRSQRDPDPGQVDLSVPEPTPTPTITPSPTPPPPLVINEILADPAGDISGDANHDGIRDGADDEFVTVRLELVFPEYEIPVAEADHADHVGAGFLERAHLGKDRGDAESPADAHHLLRVADG